MIFALAMPIISAYIPAAQVSMVLYTRPEDVALGELDDYAASPRPGAGLETLACSAEVRRTVQGHRVNRRIIRKQTWG